MKASNDEKYQAESIKTATGSFNLNQIKINKYVPKNDNL